MISRLSLRPALLLSALAVAGCSTSDPGPLPKEASVVVHGMPPNPAGTHYTLRVSTPVSDKPVSTLHGDAAYTAIGSFTVPKSADTIPLNIEGSAPVKFVIPDSVNTNIIADAIVTLDENNATSDEPGPRFLAGNFTGDDINAHATLTMQGDDAFGTALSAISGEASLDGATGSYGTDSARGIWFVLYSLDSAGNVISLSPSLSLPELPVNDETEGWTYQGWIAQQTGSTTSYTSLGRFTAPFGADANGAGPGASSGNPYPFPGEDFITGSARSLNDGNTIVLVSLDPESIALTAPFLPLMSSASLEAATPSRTPFLLQTTAREISLQISLRR